MSCWKRLQSHFDEFGGCYFGWILIAAFCFCLIGGVISCFCRAPVVADVSADDVSLAAEPNDCVVSTRWYRAGDREFAVLTRENTEWWARQKEDAIHFVETDPNDFFRWPNDPDGILHDVEVWGPDDETFLIVHPGWIIDMPDPNYLSDNTIRGLCKSGRVCEVMGHQWRDGRPGEAEGEMYADYHPGTWYRTCALCSKCEQRSLSDWE